MVWGVNGYRKDEPASAAQMTPPFVSVVSFPSLPRPEHPEAPRFVNVSPLTLIPDAKVEVAVVVPTLSADTESPPANVLVAVVEVALMLATCGVEVATTFPDESVERSMCALTLESWRFVPALKVRVPEV